MSKRFENKTAIITGGTTGLGFEAAKPYVEEGARGLITGRNQKRIDEAVADLGENVILSLTLPRLQHWTRWQKKPNRHSALWISSLPMQKTMCLQPSQMWMKQDTII
jgi:hypothetical protein